MGVVKVVPTQKGAWPKLIYPNYSVLESKLKESREEKKVYSEKLESGKKVFKCVNVS